MKNGFTLVEILVTIAIVGILSATIMGAIVEKNKNSEKTKTTRDQSISACINQGGIPLFSYGNERLEDCKFKP